MWRSFLHFIGVMPRTPGLWYNFWSGFGSDLGEFAIVGGLIGVYRRHNCHEPRCWRVGHHPVEGTPFTACRKHHPALPDKAAKGHMTKAWQAENRRRSADR